MGFDRLFEILNKVRKENPTLSKRLAEAEAFGKWEDAVGKMISKHARPVRVDQGKLWIEVDHPIWQNELQLQKTRILDILNRDQSQKPILDLVLVQPRQSNTRKNQK